MVIASFEDAKSSSLTALERDLFSPFSDREIVFGLKKSSPIFFVAVKPCGDGDDFVGSICLKALLKILQKSLSICSIRMEITHLCGATESVGCAIPIMKIEI